MPIKNQEKCKICGHFATENILCPCHCHDPFRIKSFTTKKERKAYKD